MILLFAMIFLLLHLATSRPSIFPLCSVLGYFNFSSLPFLDIACLQSEGTTAKICTHDRLFLHFVQSLEREGGE